MVNLVKESLKVIIISTVVSLSVYLVLAQGGWVEPSVAPPGGNVAAPLNTGSAGQSKSGGLILNTGGAANGLIVSSGNVGIGTTNPSARLSIVGQYYSARFVATPSIDWDNGNVQYLNLANGAQTLTFSNPKDGGVYRLFLKQPASGAAGTVTWPGAVLWSGETAPTLTATNGWIDIVILVYDGTNAKYYGVPHLNFGQTSGATFTSSTIWTAPAGVTSVDAEVWGGGGGAAGGANDCFDTWTSGGGGGGGAYSKKLNIPVTPGQGYTVTVGSGGTGGAAGLHGGIGGDSSFVNTATVLAKGGNNGANYGTAGSGGAAASGVGDTKYSGGTGGTGGSQGASGGGGGGGGAGDAGDGGNGSGTTGGSGGTAGGGAGASGGATPTGSGGTNNAVPGGGGGGGAGDTCVAGNGSAGKGGQVKLTYRR